MQETKTSDKISSEELEKLNQLIKIGHNLQGQIGQLELSKANLISKYAKVTDAMSRLKIELKKKYGEVNINFETGEYTETETPAESAE